MAADAAEDEHGLLDVALNSTATALERHVRELRALEQRDGRVCRLRDPHGTEMFTIAPGRVTTRAEPGPLAMVA